MSESKIIQLGEKKIPNQCPVCDRLHARLEKCLRQDLVSKISRLSGIAGTVPHLLAANDKAKLYMEEFQTMAQHMSQAVDLMEEVCSSEGDAGARIWARFNSELEKIVCQKSTSQDTSALEQSTGSTIPSVTENKQCTMSQTGENIAHDS